MADAVERLKQGDLAPDTEAANVPLEAPIEPVPVPVRGVDAIAAPAADPLAPAQPVTRDSNALTLRVRADWVDRMVNQAGEVAIARSRIESEVFGFKRHVNELSEALVRLRGHIREVEIQAESQMQATFQTQGVAEEFDPLEFDRFTRFQEVTRFLAESVNDISTVQHILLARLGEADAALIHQTRLNRELQQNLLRVRMVPLYSVAERLYRTVRQTARDVDKRAQLDIQGGDLEIDRSVLEKVTAPLEHLLRNALAHGIETPEERRAAGKAEFGEIVLSARQSGNEMMLTVKDDGAGLNFARIREKAEANGLLLPGVEPTESLLSQMIFTAGFSTAETVSQVAGRGVGMDVVKSEISALGGRIDIASTSGAGTCFSIYLPLTLAMTQAVMVQAAKHDYAIPAPLVQQVLELNPAGLEQAMAAGEVTWRGARYPFSYLPHLLGDTEAVHEVQRYNPVVLLQSGSSQAAVLVDVIEGTREIVVKNIGPQMARITGVAGATVRGDGRVILILNPVPLALRWASLPRTAEERKAPAESVEVSAALQPPMVLVVDDSLTVRKITTRLLTREGFRVDSAKDGVDALEKMRDLVPDVVLLDVEMPRMDGFELARVMRSDERLKSVPIIMITSRTADKHRNRAMEIGVNVYLGKPYQEQQLLDSIAEQLGQEAVAAGLSRIDGEKTGVGRPFFCLEFEAGEVAAGQCIDPCIALRRIAMIGGSEMPRHVQPVGFGRCHHAGQCGGVATAEPFFIGLRQRREQRAPQAGKIGQIKVQRTDGLAIEQGRQRHQTVGQVVAHRARQQFGVPGAELAKHRIPVFAQQRLGARFADLVQDHRLALGLGHAVETAFDIALEVVVGKRASQRGVLFLPLPFFVLVPQQAAHRVHAQENGAVTHRGRRCDQVARIFAAGHQHLNPIAQLRTFEFGQHEMRLAEMAQSAAIDQPHRDQCAVDVVGIERVDAGFVQRQRREILFFHRIPQALARVQPVAEFVLGQACAVGDFHFPTIVLAHFKQKSAHRHVARMAGVGDGAVLLHGVDEGGEIFDHGRLLKAASVRSVQIKTARSTGLFQGVLPVLSAGQSTKPLQRQVAG